MTDTTASGQTAISLPKGGGAISGIGETFQPNLFTGTGNFSVPIATSPGRNGFGPKLSLQYSTGNGNGTFGLGWQLSVPRISRKTEKGLPRYTDTDVFVMSGAEDLVPALNKDGTRLIVPERGDYSIERYRPRTEGLFARIERWRHRVQDDVHWRATTKDNVTSVYGKSPEARIANPEDVSQVFEWLLEETFDSKGNHLLYEYAHEGPDATDSHTDERNRESTQSYLRRILYGNTPEELPKELRAGVERSGTDHRDPLASKRRHYVFEVRFDYGDLPESPDIPFSWSELSDPAVWPAREDPFSNFRAGFEIRTRRLCRRVLMLHHFREGELIDAPLLKSTDFGYAVNPDTRLSFLSSVTVRGYRKDPQDNRRYLMRDMPPVSFKYSAFEPKKQRFRSIDASGGDMPPGALTDPDLTFIDIHGDGLPDVLNTGSGGYRYWRNLGDGQFDRRRAQKGDVPPVRLSEPRVSVADLGGDGLADLVIDAPPMSGFFEATPNGGWKRFKRLESMPSVNFADPDTRLLDLTGDGLSDVLVTRDTHFLWYRSKGEDGYEEPARIPRKHDLERFPDVYFSDPAERVRLADLTGDGLNDIVMLHDGHIAYWPNLGYGHFGARVTMANTPRIGQDFDPKRVFLVDLDGSGCADLVYVDQSRVRFWFNQSGNAWSTEQVINGTPHVTDLTAVQFADFFGSGTSALVWSYDYGSVSGGNYKVLDFCGGIKPNLLIEMDNNLGATTRAQYVPSTKFYLEDRKNGTPWVTSLPFPVQVLEKTEVIDHISKTKLVTTYKYHHGYYDGREREFRGFGRVDQYDTEEFGVFSQTGLHGENEQFENLDKAFHVPPVLTKQWFHTGVYFDENLPSADGKPYDKEDMTAAYRREFYQDDHRAFALDEHMVAVSDAPHETYRALRGSLIRSEVYGLDGSEQAQHPYVVTEHRYQVCELQGRRGNAHGVYFPISKETLTYNYERNPEDPRIAHSLTLAFDEYANVTESAEIAYPRRRPLAPMLDEDGNPVLGDDGKPDVSLTEQQATKVVYTCNRFINKDDDPSFYFAGVSYETRRFEVYGLDWEWPAADELLPRPLTPINAEAFDALLSSDNFERFENDPPADLSAPEKRLIEWSCTHYRRDEASETVDVPSASEHRLPLGKIESLGLPYESYQAAFDGELLRHLCGVRAEGVDLATEGGYVKEDGTWWIPTGRQGFDAGSFFTATVAQDAFGGQALQQPDAYALLTELTRDALGNRAEVKNDYRVLQPYRMTDINDNRTEVRFDALGLVVGTAIMGKADRNEGDRFDGFVSDLDQDVIDAHLVDPTHAPMSILGQATSRLVYDLKCCQRSVKAGRDPQPNVVYTLARETHHADAGDNTRVQHSFRYSDGFGREVQTKIQAEPGPVPKRDSVTGATVGNGGRVANTEASHSSRWVGTGWTVFNNKGKPVRQYEPFFTDHHGFEFDVRVGVSSTLFYDPLERAICTIYANHAYDKTTFDAWQQKAWDANDTLRFDPRTDADVAGYTSDFFAWYDSDFLQRLGRLPATWYLERMKGTDAAEKEAAQKTELHHDTPKGSHLDSLGRVFLTIEDNGSGKEGKLKTHIQLDIEGNDRTITDPRGVKAFRHHFDVAGRKLKIESVDAGEKLLLPAVDGQPLRTWDANGNIVTIRYDELRRPTETWVERPPPRNDSVLSQVRVYGERHADAKSDNLRGQLYMVLDGSGVTVNQRFDFKGNPLETKRALVKDFRQVPDWSSVGIHETPAHIEQAIQANLEEEAFFTAKQFDALNRVTTEVAPDHTTAVLADPDPGDGSIYKYTYNEANLLERIDVDLKPNRTPGSTLTPFVTSIAYNAKGQREAIVYGNGVTTRYSYDDKTFRLTRLRSKRGDGEILQDLSYTYDPVGNIIGIRDDAVKTIYHDQQVIDKHSKYTYDPLYRLIEATGREHKAIGAAQYRMSDFMKQSAFAALPRTTDSQALQMYTERYAYDSSGNLIELKHLRGTDSNGAVLWKRQQDYAIGADGNPASNRITHSGAIAEEAARGDKRYEISNDANGNITALGHLREIGWDYSNQMVEVKLDASGNTAFYQYDFSGQRTRKVVLKGTRRDERIYMGGFEVCRIISVDRLKFERQTLHVMDDKERIALVEYTTHSLQPVGAAVRTRYQLSNHLGSSVMEVDTSDAANIISLEEYYPYGGTSYIGSANEREVSAKRYRYSGKERDEETGLCYFGLRYYVPWFGRWANTDPKGTIDGFNGYRFASDNPARYVDPNGTQSVEPEKTQPPQATNICVDQSDQSWYPNSSNLRDVPVSKNQREAERDSGSNADVSKQTELGIGVSFTATGISPFLVNPFLHGEVNVTLNIPDSDLLDTRLAVQGQFAGGAGVGILFAAGPQVTLGRGEGARESAIQTSTSIHAEAGAGFGLGANLSADFQLSSDGLVGEESEVEGVTGTTSMPAFLSPRLKPRGATFGAFGGVGVAKNVKATSPSVREIRDSAAEGILETGIQFIKNMMTFSRVPYRPIGPSLVH